MLYTITIEGEPRSETVALRVRHQDRSRKTYAGTVAPGQTVGEVAMDLFVSAQAYEDGLSGGYAGVHLPTLQPAQSVPGGE